MNKRFILHLLSKSSDHLRVWAYIYSQTNDNGLIKTTLYSIARALSLHHEVVKRIVYFDPVSEFYAIFQPALASEGQARWNSKEITIEFFSEKEISSSDQQHQFKEEYQTDSIPLITVDDHIAKKISQVSSEEHWINKLIKESLPNVAKIKTQMTTKQAVKIDQRYDEALVISKLKSMDNYVRGTKQIKLVYQIYSSVYGTLDEWCNREQQKRGDNTRKAGQSEIAISIAKKEQAGNFSKIVKANEAIKDMIEKGDVSLKNK